MTPKTAGELLAEALRNKKPLDRGALQAALQRQADQINAEAPPHLRVPGGVSVSVEITESSSASPGYTIRDDTHSDDPRAMRMKSITCHTCGLTSHLPDDVQNRYCANCHRFHEDNPKSCNSLKK